MYTKSEVEQAQNDLREIFPIGSKVTTKALHVTRSGMRRVVGVYVNGTDGPRDVSWEVARALGDRFDEYHRGIVVKGAGFSAGFDVVYRLGWALYRDNFYCIGEGDPHVRHSSCPSNDHVNRGPMRDVYDLLHKHSDPGYSLRHREI